MLKLGKYFIHLLHMKQFFLGFFLAFWLFFSIINFALSKENDYDKSNYTQDSWNIQGKIAGKKQQDPKGYEIARTQLAEKINISEADRTQADGTVISEEDFIDRAVKDGLNWEITKCMDSALSWGGSCWYKWQDIPLDTVSWVGGANQYNPCGWAGQAACDITNVNYSLDVSKITPMGGFKNSNQNLKGKVNSLVLKVIGQAILALWVIAVLVMTIGAGYMILHWGDDSLLSKWKSIFMAGIYAMALALSSYLLIAIVRYLLFNSF